MRVNVSAIKLFQRSQREWFFKYHLKRVPRRPEGAYLFTGSWWHSVVEHLAKHKSLDIALEFACDLQKRYLDDFAQHGSDIYWQKLVKDFSDETSRLIRLFPMMPLRFIPENILSVEESIEVKLPDSQHTLIGRPDQVILLKDKYWHLQFKTISDRTPMSVFVPTRARDLHELAYAYLICGKYCTPEQYGGTLLNVVRKISNKAITEDPGKAFVQELIPISFTDVWDAISDIIAIADDMEAVITGKRRLIENRESDTNKFGNVISPYFEALYNKASIEDNFLYMDAPQDRYDVEEA